MRPSAPCRPRPPHDSEDMARARALLAGPGADPDDAADLLALSGRLKAERRFGLARRVLARVWEAGVADEALRRKVRQQRALCTYKDPDLPADPRLSEALAILGDGREDLGTTRDQETLGLAGAIHKRRWEIDGQPLHLERALAYYDRGYAEGPESDQGYTAINAAFVLDILAALESQAAAEAGATSAAADVRRQRARAIREDLVARLPGLPEREGMAWLTGQWWFHATLVEAYFGLERHEEAAARIEEALDLSDVPEWEYRSTAEQLAALARIRSAEPGSAEDFAASPAGRVLHTLLRGRAAGVRTAFVGKVGLGLSGGGFRASLYHIGVLARLAELDVLRHVEAISCVSGGSILGAYYYLELKKLLEDKVDEEIDRQDYIDLVRRVEAGFLAGVQQNVRVRVAADLWTNLRMVLRPGYSRTQRVGELYEECLYSRVADGAGGRPRWVSDLFVAPRGEKEGFTPRGDNWRRAAKVPDLILNATTLNTGHNWQFTASWMGEPPGSIDPDVDGNYRLRRMYYGEAPEPHRCIRLGHAVGASACVPGLFEPLALEGLYPDVTVRLVDGGVHDNQGIVGLMERECSVILVSDASGQMGTVDDPSSGLLGVPLRSNSILMSRVREEQYDELASRRRSGLLRAFMFVHLKKGLGVEPRAWTGSTEPAAPDSAGTHTSYGVLTEAQRLIAGIRTDLDSFSEAEAFALMSSGYRMTREAFETDEALRALPLHHGPPERWRFQDVDEALTGEGAAARLLRHLAVGANKAFKAWMLSRPLEIAGHLLLLLALPLGAWALWAFRARPLVTVGGLTTMVVVAAVTAVVGPRIMSVVRWRATVQSVAKGVALATVGWVAARIHLAFFDPVFLRLGRVPRRGGGAGRGGATVPGTEDGARDGGADG